MALFIPIPNSRSFRISIHKGEKMVESVKNNPNNGALAKTMLHYR